MPTQQITTCKTCGNLKLAGWRSLCECDRKLMDRMAEALRKLHHHTKNNYMICGLNVEAKMVLDEYDKGE